MSRVEIIHEAGRDWVAGLTWRSFSEHPSLRERREDAHLLGADWVALRETLEVTQAGFCKAIKSRRPRKLYSLAAAIAEEYQQPWLGVFKLSESLWWYIAVRDGQAILPDGDVVGDYASILEVRRRHEAYGDWNIHDGTIEDLLPLLEFSPKSLGLAPVVPVEPPPIWKGLLPVSLVLVLLIVAITLYVHHRNQVRMAARQAVEAIIRAREQSMSPLQETPPANVWLSACGAALKPLPLAINGWLANDVSCVGNAAIVIWDRLGNATTQTRPAGELLDDGNKVLQRYSLGQLPSGSNMMANYIDEDEQLYNLLQPIGVQAVVGRAVRTSNRTYFVQQVNFDLPISPFDIDFSAVSGLRITALNWTPTGWTIGGMIYGK